jgi:hypothetical protein
LAVEESVVASNVPVATVTNAKTKSAWHPAFDER